MKLSAPGQLIYLHTHTAESAPRRSVAVLFVLTHFPTADKFHYEAVTGAVDVEEVGLYS